MTTAETFRNCWTCDSRYNSLCAIHGSLQNRELMAPTNCQDWWEKWSKSDRVIPHSISCTQTGRSAVKAQSYGLE